MGIVFITSANGEGNDLISVGLSVCFFGCGQHCGKTRKRIVTKFPLCNPLFRVRPWNNGVRCMYFYLLIGQAWYDRKEQSDKMGNVTLNALSAGFLLCFQGNPCLLATLRKTDERGVAWNFQQRSNMRPATAWNISGMLRQNLWIQDRFYIDLCLLVMLWINGRTVFYNIFMKCQEWPKILT